MVESIDLTGKKEINRREALLSIGSGKEVICRMKTGELITIEVITTMKELEHVVNLEQRTLCNKLEFFKK